MLRVCGGETDLVDVPAGLRGDLAEQSKQFDAGAFVYMISVLEELRRSVKSSRSGRALVEAAIVRLAEASKFSSIESLLQCVDGSAASGGSVSTRPVAAPKSAPRAKKNAPPVVATEDEARPDERPSRPTRGSTGGPGTPVRTPSAAPVAAQQEPVPASIGRRMTQADLKAAHAEPLVKAAIDVLGGQVVHVHRDDNAAKPPETAAIDD